MADILLVNPVHPAAIRYGGFSPAAAPVYPPLGLLYLAAWLREKSAHGARLLDAEADGLEFAELAEQVLTAEEHYIGVTLRTAAYPAMREMMRAWRRQGKVVIAGGIHPTIDPDGVLQDGAADYVVRGEGEQTLLELLDGLTGGGTIDGLRGISCLGASGQVVTTADREYLADLDQLPRPARELIDLHRYRPGPQHYKQLPHTSMIASRGCPYRCTFCSSRSLWGKKYRVRSVASVMVEIDHLQEQYGIKDICFWDDLWGLDAKWAREFCAAVKGRGITWSCEARVDSLSEELIAEMAASGCFCIFFGFESLQDEVLARIHKETTREQIEQVARWTEQYGIEVRANFILGLPGETKEQARQNFAEVCRLNFDFVKYNIFTPYPGTEAYAWIQANEPERLTVELSRFTGYHATYLPADYQSLDELEALRDRFLRRYYLRPRYIWKRLQRLRSWSELKKNIAGLKALLRG